MYSYQPASWKKWGKESIVAFQFCNWMHDLSAQLPFQIFTTCVRWWFPNGSMVKILYNLICVMVSYTTPSKCSVAYHNVNSWARPKWCNIWHQADAKYRIISARFSSAVKFSFFTIKYSAVDLWQIQCLITRKLDTLFFFVLSSYFLVNIAFYRNLFKKLLFPSFSFVLLVQDGTGPGMAWLRKLSKEISRSSTNSILFAFVLRTKRLKNRFYFCSVRSLR